MSQFIRWVCILGVFALSVACSSHADAKSEDHAEQNRANAWWLGGAVARTVVGVMLAIELGRP